MPSATERIAEKLAARKAAAAAPTPVEEDTDEGIEAEDTDDALLPGEDLDENDELADDPEASDDDDDNEEEAPVKPTVAERAKAAREARAAKNAPGAKAPKVPSSKATEPTKKGPSPAQIAARERFAERSRANAAAKRAAEATPAKAKAVAKGKQTEAEIKAAQDALRKAAKAEQTAKVAAATKPVGTSKAVTVKAAAKPAAKAVNGAAAKATPAKAAKEKPTHKAGTTKTRVMALWGKGKNRREIAEALGITYAAVFHHTKDLEGNATAARGRIFVDTDLNEEGEKLGKGKTETVSRSEAMRRLYNSGMAVGDIARHFEVRYQLAYTAIRSLFGTDTEE